MTWIDLEREALAAAFRTAGPDAATLCTGWATRHLLAHLVQRENQPLANIVDQLSRRPPVRRSISAGSWPAPEPTPGSKP